MKSSKLKIVLSIFLLLGLVAGGALWYVVSTKIKPEEIRKLTLTELSKVFPNAEIELGKIDLGIGASIKLDAEKFIIRYPLKKEKIDIFKVNYLSAKIPVWTILMGGGAVDLIVDKPEVKYLSYRKSNLWQMAMGDKKKGESQPTQSKSSKNKKETSRPESAEDNTLSVPSFAANSSLNLSFNDIKLEYGEVGKTAGKIDINKFMVKNLGLKKDAAYEINSKVMLAENDGKQTSLKTLLIGEFNFKNFLDNGEISSKAVLTLSDINVANFEGSIPEFRNDIDLKVSKQGDVSLNLAGEFERSNYKVEVNMTNENISIENILINLMLMDLKNMMPAQMATLSPGKSVAQLSGVVRLKGEKIYPDLSYKLSDKVRVNLPDMALDLSSSGRVTESRLTSVSNTNLFGGAVDASLTANYNLNDKETDFQKKLKSYVFNLDLNNLKFEKSFLQKTLYPPQKEEVKRKDVKSQSSPQKKAALNKKEASGTVPLLPSGVINIKAKSINLGGKNMGANGSISTKGNSVDIKNLKFMLERGEANVKTNLKMFKNITKTKFDIGMKNINISSFDGVIPNQFSGSKGLFSGNISGNASTGKKLNYDVKVKLNASNGELKGIDLKPYLEKVYSLAKKIPGLDKKVDPNKKIDYTGDFKVFNLSGQFKPNHYLIRSSEFIGLDNLIEAKANGNIYPETKKEAKVYADIVENKYLSNYVEAYAGTRTIPVLFKGQGVALNADYQYTVKKLTNRVIKKNKSKVKKKVKKKAKEEIKKGLDKIFKGKENKKIDKLLKGLF
jgi:hypothetical protein